VFHHHTKKLLLSSLHLGVCEILCAVAMTATPPLLNKNQARIMGDDAKGPVEVDLVAKGCGNVVVILFSLCFWI